MWPRADHFALNKIITSSEYLINEIQKLPDGKYRRWYSGNVVLDRGEAAHTFRLALNDRGRFRIEVAEAVSGMQAGSERTVPRERPRGFEPTAAPAGTAAVMCLEIAVE